MANARYTPKVGQYEYHIRGREWRIYQVDWVGENGASSAQYTGIYFWTKEEASAKVYELNGWKKRN